MAMKFDYYEIRPCVEFDGYTESYLAGSDENGNPTLEASEAEARKALARHKTAKRMFWTLYGRYFDADAGGHLACAIGDFNTAKDAFEVMNAILAPMVDACATVRRETYERGHKHYGMPRTYQSFFHIRNAALDLEAIINRSSNEERI